MMSRMDKHHYPSLYNKAVSHVGMHKYATCIRYTRGKGGSFMDFIAGRPELI